MMLSRQVILNNNLGKATRPPVAAVHGDAVGVDTTMLPALRSGISCGHDETHDAIHEPGPGPGGASSWLLPARIDHVCGYAMFARGQPLECRCIGSWLDQ
jgi:hypothetical protein